MISSYSSRSLLPQIPSHYIKNLQIPLDLFWITRQHTPSLLLPPPHLLPPGTLRLYPSLLFYQRPASLPQFPKIWRSNAGEHGRHEHHAPPLFPAQPKHRGELQTPTQKSFKSPSLLAVNIANITMQITHVHIQYTHTQQAQFLQVHSYVTGSRLRKDFHSFDGFQL